jgi:ribosomal 30S subunit maturation factor RimM
VVEGSKRHLIPHVDGIIQSIDIKEKKVIADWDPEF